MDLGFFRVPGCKERIEIVPAADGPGVGFPKFQRFLKYVVLDIIHNLGDLAEETILWNGHLLLWILVSSSHEHGPGCHVSRADFDPDRDSLFYPVPSPGAADIPAVDLHTKPSVIIIGIPKRLGEGFRIFHHRSPFRFFSAYGHQHHLG